MSDENVELVRKAVAAFSEGIDAPQPFLARDFVWHTAPGWVEDADYVGIEAFRGFVSDWADTFKDFAFGAREVRAVDDRVLVRLQVRGRGRDSNLPIDWEFGVLFSDFRDGTIGDAQAFMTWEAAIETVGLA